MIRFGVRLPVSGPVAGVESIVSAARSAEELGYDAVWVHDHLAWSTEMHRHHISSGAAESIEESQNPDFYESLTTLSYLAGMTSKVRLGIACVVLPCRNPVYLAKQAANLDVLSQGRLILGVGLGSKASRMSKEFDLLNVPFKKRARITDEYIQALRSIWTQPHASFHGRFISFDGVEIFPKPLQKPHPPIWVGGWTPFSRDRAARLGDGWIPGWLSPQEMKENVEILRENARSLGRNPSEIRIAVEKWVSVGTSKDEALRNAHQTITESLATYERDVNRFEQAEERHLFGSPDDLIDKLNAFVDAGVEEFELKFIYPTLDRLLEIMSLFADKVMTAFR